MACLQQLTSRRGNCCIGKINWWSTSWSGFNSANVTMQTNASTELYTTYYYKHKKYIHCTRAKYMYPRLVCIYTRVVIPVDIWIAPRTYSSTSVSHWGYSNGHCMHSLETIDDYISYCRNTELLLHYRDAMHSSLPKSPLFRLNPATMAYKLHFYLMFDHGI